MSLNIYLNKLQLLDHTHMGAAKSRWINPKQQNQTLILTCHDLKTPLFALDQCWNSQPRGRNHSH